MKKFALLLILIPFYWTVTAQETFTKIISGGKTEEGISVIQTADGGYAFLGITEVLSPYDDRWLVRTDSQGDTLWTKTFKGIGTYEWNDRGLVQTDDGGFTFLAHRNGKTDLMHVSATGDSVWEKELYAGRGCALSLTSDKGYVVAGIGGGNNFYIYACHTNSTGDIDWQKYYRFVPAGIISGVDLYAVRPVRGDGFILGGETGDFISCSTPFLFRIGSGGDSLWTKKYVFKGYESLYSVDTVTGCGFYATGQINFYTSLIMKLNSDGDTLWTRVADDQILPSIRSTSDGGVIACGINNANHSPGAYIVKYSQSGVRQWERVLLKNSPASGLSIENTSDHGYIICGAVDLAQDSTNAILVKVDGSGYAYGIGEKTGNENISVYPNPASRQTLLTLGQDHTGKPVTVRLYDSFGRVVKTFEFPETRESYRLDVTGLADGIYLVAAGTGSEMTGKTKLILKQQPGE